MKLYCVFFRGTKECVHHFRVRHQARDLARSLNAIFFGVHWFAVR